MDKNKPADNPSKLIHTTSVSDTIINENKRKAIIENSLLSAKKLMSDAAKILEAETEEELEKKREHKTIIYRIREEEAEARIEYENKREMFQKAAELARKKAEEAKNKYSELLKVELMAFNPELNSSYDKSSYSGIDSGVSASSYYSEDLKKLEDLLSTLSVPAPLPIHQSQEIPLPPNVTRETSDGKGEVPLNDNQHTKSSVGLAEHFQLPPAFDKRTPPPQEASSNVDQQMKGADEVTTDVAGALPYLPHD